MSTDKTFILGMAGGSGSGKSTLAQILQKQFGEDQVQIVGQDHYYHDWDVLKEMSDEINFDHPKSLDFELLSNHINQIKLQQDIQIPLYDCL